MKIAIDIRPLRDTITGIGRYLSKLLEGLEKCDNQNEYLLFWSNLTKPAPKGLPTSPNFKQISYHIPGKAITALWAYTEIPPAELLIGKIDLFYSPGFQVPPTRKAARVFTIYDLIPIIHPEMAIPSAVHHVRPRFRHYAQRADLIVTISNASAKDIIEHLGVPEDKVIVSYPGTTQIPKISAEECAVVRKRFRLEKDFILFVSRLDPRKNLARLFQAFERSGLSRDFDLVVTGPKGWHMEKIIETWRKSSCKNQIRWLDYVSDSELSALYVEATIFAFPSVMEGFGLPILEAMSVGCPVLTSNVSSMPEVGGEAALYVDPLDIESISDGLVRLASDTSLRQKLSQLGLLRAANFTWDKTATQMIEAYKKACELARNRKRER